jgi:hypothetical protein
MNFFGHAVIAALEDAEPRFVLGAMLPDLCSMAGLQLKSSADPSVARGIAQHHRIDHAFHGIPAFVALCAGALTTLERAGVSRATARAVGHVGSQLLLDGALAPRSAALRAYRAALACASDDERVTLGLELRRGSAALLPRLALRLSAAAIPDGYREPRFVAERLTWILARRPRLALAEGDHVPVLAWLEEAAVIVAREADDVVARLAPRRSDA